MQLENYLLYLEKTVESIPNKIKKYLIKQFIDSGIIVKNISGQLFLNHDDISEKNITEQIICCIHNSLQARILYEKWEFIKDYKYSVLYTCDNIDTLIEQISNLTPLDNVCENEYILKLDSLNDPIVYRTEKFDFLKFNLVFATSHPLTQEEFLLKYPFLVVIHKEDKIIEFRFDVIKKLYVSGKKETMVYADLICDVKNYLQDCYHCTLDSLDMDFIVNVSKNDQEVKLVAQYMKLPSGGNAQLEVGNNQEYVLPVIGELKSILADNQSDLEKTPSLKEALEQFMYEMEEMSDYPWIELLWENEIKTRSIRVKFVFNYMNNHYCLIQHYYSNFLIGMERMNYVTKYIVNHRNDDGKTTEE